MTVPKEGDLASLAARFENHLRLSSPETSTTRRVPAQPGHPVTADDVEYVHALIERALEFGLSKAGTVIALSSSIDTIVTTIVWDRLEAENPEFFDLYATIERQSKSLSRCNSSCSLSTQEGAVSSKRVSPVAGYVSL